VASKFRTSFTHKEGLDTARLAQGRIINTNLVNWTVDVRSQFDRYLYPDIQVGAPYLDFVSGAGIYAFPEVGCDCMVAMPSDSSPPFIMSFLMPYETIDTSSEDAPQGTTSRGAPGKLPNTASFAGGRPKAKPGDIWMRGRDGNFVVLHRGGVLQIGATELAQRIFIPIGNIVTDVSGQYNHHNAMGSITWGLQEGPSQQQVPGMYTHTFRVNADDKYADVRVRVGKVVAISEPANGEQAALSQLNIGTKKEAPIVYEVILAPGGFAEDGSLSGTSVPSLVKLRYFFDRAGGAFMRSEGSVLLSVRNKLSLNVHGDFSLACGGVGNMTFEKGLDVNGGTHVSIKGGVVRLNGGKQPNARAGDLTTTPVTAAVVGPGLVAPPGGGPVTGVLTLLSPLTGIITSGEPTVLS
jgi:hypothetical protein